MISIKKKSELRKICKTCGARQPSIRLASPLGFRYIFRIWLGKSFVISKFQPEISVKSRSRILAEAFWRLLMHFSAKKANRRRSMKSLESF